ncbi:coiled [Tachypleus tridentatus]|uniref:coiled n=1 Tax=Tachypleus tridentatus TaxID=6853 RepID=UPI003FD5BA7F
MTNLNLWCTIISFFIISTSVFALECYVCTNQENNEDKCVKTIKTCEPVEERCLSEIKWGSTPYWAPSGEKQFYITKRCATGNVCEEYERNVSKRCDKIWYNDWECVECCHGDRCNYYVTLAGVFEKGSLLIVTISAALVLITTKLL